MKKIRKDKHNKYLQTVEDTLDLHHSYSREAVYAVSDFLNNAQEQHMSKVRIIVGKGIHSTIEGGVLGDVVRNYLHDNNFNYTDAKIQDGGSGAIDISL